MKSSPPKLKGFLFGCILGLCFFGILILGSRYALGPEDHNLELALTIPGYILMVMYCYSILGLLTIRYTASDDGLRIRWANRILFCPWKDIVEIKKVSGRLNLINFLGISWPGHIAGTYDIKGIGPSKIFGSDLKKLVVIKHGALNYAITPPERFVEEIARRSGAPLTELNTYDLSDSEIGVIIDEDIGYLALFALNVIVLIFLAIYLAIFFPGSGADPFTLLLFVLGIAILAFNMANASRLFHYIASAAYLLWFIGLMINIAFLILSIQQIGFGL